MLNCPTGRPEPRRSMSRWPHRSDAFCYGRSLEHNRLCGLALHACLLVLLAGAALRAAVPPGILTAQVSSATVPPGGTAQVRISLASPQALVSGEVVMDVNPTVFGDIATVDVFSVTGDQLGTVSIQGRHLDAQFNSPTGGLGRLPGVPILAVSVPILPNAPTGAARHAHNRRRSSCRRRPRALLAQFNGSGPRRRAQSGQLRERSVESRRARVDRPDLRHRRRTDRAPQRHRLHHGRYHE